MKVLVLAMAAGVTWAQVPTAMTVDACYNLKSNTKYFCKRIDNGSVTSVPKIYEQTGWCCD